MSASVSLTTHMYAHQYSQSSSSYGQQGRAILAQAYTSGGGSSSGSSSDPFTKYDQLSTLVTSLSSAESSRRRGDDELQRAEQAFSANETALRKNREKQPYQEKRLKRNAHPRFLHYFQINREDKVKRLERELVAMREDERQREQASVVLGETVKERKRDLEALRATEAELNRAKAERLRIFDSVVESQPPSGLLANLRAQKQQNDNDIATDGNLVNQVQSILGAVQSAQQMFNRAYSQIREASMMNTTAGITNFVDMADGRRNNNEFAERMMQMRRDQMMNQARDTALQAGDQLQRAFDMFPMEARVRYPNMTQNLCNAPLPDLRGANFFGTMAVGWAFGNMGDMMNNMHARAKIDNNLRMLQQCEMVARQQADTIVMVLNQINASLATMNANSARLASAVQSERNNMFEQSRSRAGSTNVYAVPAAAQIYDMPSSVVSGYGQQDMNGYGNADAQYYGKPNNGYELAVPVVIVTSSAW